jgi:23S rRNA pseudouridine2605 synthase
MSESQRLSKVLAAAGVASRRACEEIIVAGRVLVNRKRVIVPQTLVDALKDVITVDGKRVRTAVKKLYYVLNKPLGYHCTSAQHIKRRAIDLVPCEGGERLFTIGRLDKETTGIILLTNDGHFAHRVMHPSGGITKEYLAKVNNEITHDHLVAIANGCEIEGKHVKPLEVIKVRRATVRIIVQEGRHHEIREFLSAAKLKTLDLKRIRIGNLSLGKLPAGAYRTLSQEEVDNLFPETAKKEASSDKKPIVVAR